MKVTETLLRPWKRPANSVASEVDACNRRIFAETLQELRVLGLSGVCFEPWQLAQELGKYLGIDIKIAYFSDSGHPLLRQRMESVGVVAALFCSPEHKKAWIIVPDGLTGIARRKVIYHELMHVAAGHQIRPRYLVGKHAVSDQVPDSNTPWRPFRRLARREPPETAAACEEDADLRAEAVLKASVYGRKAADRPEHFCALKDHAFPTPASVPRLLQRFLR